MKRYFLIIFIVLGMSACAGNNSSNLTNSTPNTPGYVVEQFSQAMYRGDLETALSYVDVSNASPGEMRSVLQKSISGIREMGGMKFYNVIKTDYSDSQREATVESQSDIPSLGKRVGGNTHLRKINGEWKVVLN